MPRPQLHSLPDTRERILAAAEALFMERGYAATSLREITSRARVNLAAVNYHFGSKAALVREVFERRLGPLNAARIAYLDRLEAAAGGRPLKVASIVEAILMPALQVSRDPLAGGAVFLRLLGRALTEPAGFVREVLAAHYRQVIIRFKEAFARALPHLSDQELAWRMHFMFGAMSYTLAGNDALQLIGSCRLEGADDAKAIIRRLIPFLAAGLQAPVAEAGARRARKAPAALSRKAA
ncbi:MAG TPA: TetR/AcrR family transcriptional regulator [Burkholderiales bacterium]|jgi:AcrR family transcriptional regulator|nr:TetR/AcrR family transcriptional regulator [Burkholderiales bacterium]